MDLLLIRHARPKRVEQDTGPADPGLTAEGLSQTEALVRWLAEEQIDAVYTSPATRARETAEPLAVDKGRKAVEAEGLLELGFGGSIYVPAEEAVAEGHPAVQSWRERIDRRIEDDPEFAEFQTRVADAVEEIVARHASQQVAVISHGFVINAFVAHVLDHPWPLLFLPDYTSISRLRAGSRTGRRSVHTLNETGHLRCYT